MKILIISILLFFCVKVHATDVYTATDANGTRIIITESICPYIPDSIFNLALLEVDGKKYTGCWTTELNVVIIIWNVNGIAVEQHYKPSDFVLGKLI